MAQDESQDWQAWHDDTFVDRLGDVRMRRVEGLREFALVTTLDHRNRSGAVHGGVIMTLLDRALGFAAGEAAQGRVVTTSFTTHFERGVPVGSFLIARPRISHAGRRAVFGEVEALCDGRRIASATGVFLRLPDLRLPEAPHS